MTVIALLVLVSATLALGQRPFFAGSKPIGYPELTTTTTEGLGDRFGEVDGTTQRLPIEANGDRDLIDRLSKLPIDNQPFWFINWQALEAHRQKPQSYPQKPNQFVDTIQGSNSGSASFNSANVTSSSGNPSDSPNTVSNAVNPANVNSNSTPNGNTDSVANTNENASEVATSNRFGEDESSKVPSKDQENKTQGSSSTNSNVGNSVVGSNVKNQTYFVPQPYYL